MENIPELQFTQKKVDSFNFSEKRLWATLCFRLGMLLTQSGLTSLHKRGSPLMEKLLKCFNQEKRHPDTTTAPQKCINLCRIAISVKVEPNPNAARLLVGIEEAKYESIERQVDDIVVINNNISSTLRGLLTMMDPHGRNRFFIVLSSPDDYLSSTPLESAYYWSLSCNSALNGYLQFMGDTGEYTIKCNKLLPGRLFWKSDERKSDESDELI